MSQKNDFKAFSISDNANVISQADYENDQRLQKGFPPENITTHLLNKVLRQSSTISAVVANFIETQSGEDVLDNGDIAKLADQLNRALQQKITTGIPTASLTQKGVVQLTNVVGNSDILAVTQKWAQEIINSLNKNINDRVPNTRKINGKPLTGDISLNALDVGAASINDAMRHAWMNGGEILYNGCSGFVPNAPFLTRYGLPPNHYGVLLRISNKSGVSSEGVPDVWSHRLVFMHGGDTYRTDSINAGYKLTRKFWDDKNANPDANGFLKISSPMVDIYPDGTFSTNEEAEGVEVTKEGVGIYRISNILGYNADGAWGIQGGISVPHDNNNLELIFVKDQVQPNGAIIIETFHRQHMHLPEQFQNWRLKSIDDNGKQVFYKDGEPCDIPEYCRLNIRVQMPEDSLWKLKQKKLQQEMENTHSYGNELEL
ncbi:tail fiber protein [Photorhabdus tasmaniensis]|uniref:Phage tail protein n=1 Tax=Photorhabdus tasmaniensis TaxID=1004159 RepID=A0ABX0GEK8_9GAMM|nr:tail fiber protein [Photorhabdus tasmaniensis]NHB87209.1 phage tail protein [Photorhabdus tasmaniensis]